MKDCNECQHYCPQRSFIDLQRAYDRSAPRVPIMDSLKTLRKQETEVLEFEAEHLFELYRARELFWPQVPRIAPFCAAAERPQVASLKNKDGDCGDFMPGFARAMRACQSCRNVQEPETQIGDRENPLERHDTEYWKHWMDVNQQQETADATAQALEIEQTFHGDGVLAGARFLPTCGARTSSVGRLVVPFCNARRDCGEHRPLLPLEPWFLDRLRKSTVVPRQALTDLTIELVKLVLGTFPESPGDFIESVPSEAARWASFMVNARWFSEVGEVPMEERARVMRTAVPLALPEIWPVICGCDALEWGALAGMAREKEQMTSVIVVQQAAEWFMGTFHPTSRRAGIEALRSLLAAVFPESVASACDPLLLRLRARAAEEEANLIEDPLSFLEEALKGLSFRIEWLRAARQAKEREKDLRRRGLSDDWAERIGMGRVRRKQQTDERIRVAQRLAAELMRLINNRLTNTINTIIANEIEKAIKEITDEDTAAARAVIGEDMDLEQALMKAGTAQLGIPFTPELQQVFGQKLDTDRARNEDRFRNIEILQLQPQRIALLLTLVRGSEPVTPCLFNVRKLGTPTHAHLPADIAEARDAPTGRTLEAFHAARFEAAPAAGAYLARCRSLPCPLPETDVQMYWGQP